MTKTEAFRTKLSAPLPDKDDFEEMIQNLTDIRRDLINCWADVEKEFKHLRNETKDSARNLVHYVALRRHDVRRLQTDLARHGISSLGRSESYVMMNIDKVLRLLHRIVQRPFEIPPECENVLSLDEGRVILKDRTEALLGVAPEHRKVRIMVTLPGEAADDYPLVRELVANGMDCARINCAHDDAAAWKRMVENIKRARKETGRKCKICFDIGGPKLRTGAIEEGARVLKWKPARDLFGRVVKRARIFLASAENPEIQAVSDCRIQFPADFLLRLKTGGKLVFKDARGSRRVLFVKEKNAEGFMAECVKTAYVTPETEFKIERHEPETTAKPLNIPPLEQFIPLRKGDLLVLTKTPKPGKPPKFKINGDILKPARVPCTLSEVFNDVKEGEKIWFDDGKIGGVIKSVTGREITVRVTNAGADIQKLRADKGINLPDSDLRFPSLTEKDLADLEFIVRHADLIGFSFVRSAVDVVALQNKLKELKGRHLGIILKIETRRAFENLPEILLTAMSSPAVGVMIARGDLAVETGFERLAEVQEEILWMCEAAHLPVIWATQVLENLSKEGVYTRAEITDAAMSERAECVMLNKGAFVVEAVRTLDNILTRMESHQDKKRPMLRRLKLAERFFEVFKKGKPISAN